jgi:hypothetical protein
VLRDLDGIEHGLAEVGQGGGGFALYAALRHAGGRLITKSRAYEIGPLRVPSHKPFPCRTS